MYKYVFESGLTYDELILNLVPGKGLRLHIENVQNFDIRDDDIYLATFPKSDFFYPWFQYVKEWERFSKKNPDQILNIYFEALKEDSVPEIKKINEFLGTERSDELMKEIAEACSFNNLKKANAKVKIPEEFMVKSGNPCFFRLGEVGDWKNYFTVGQNERVNEWIEENFVETDLKFRYTL